MKRLCFLLAFSFLLLRPLSGCEASFTAVHTYCTDFTFTADTTQPGIFTWDFGDGRTDTGSFVIHNFPASGFFTVVLHADFGSCQDTAMITVQVDATQPPMTVPNVFTPNGDGINDEFVIDGLVECTPFVLEIYDRWGVLLFTTEHPVFVHWQGKSMDGNPVPEGMYYYLLYSELYTTMGTVAVFR